MIEWQYHELQIRLLGATAWVSEELIQLLESETMKFTVDRFVMEALDSCLFFSAK